jgi:hypothetical protein
VWPLRRCIRYGLAVDGGYAVRQAVAITSGVDLSSDTAFTPEPDGPPGTRKRGNSRGTCRGDLRVANSKNSYEMADNFNAMRTCVSARREDHDGGPLPFSSLSDASFRAQLMTEHSDMSKLPGQYLAALREAYAAELRSPP